MQSWKGRLKKPTFATSTWQTSIPNSTSVLLKQSLITELQEGFVNFYNPATVNPYVALAARGPWIITSHGAVVHDNGGYGMLGLATDPTA